MVVLGVGNELLKDEGVGIHVARALSGEALNDAVEVIEGGTALDVLPGEWPIDKLVVVDAVRGGCEPGAIYRFSIGEVEPESSKMTSLHELSLFDGLALSEVSGIRPQETIIIGIEPKDVDWGMELSTEIQERMPEIIRIVLQEVTGNSGSGLTKEAI